ncbi:hypothetical protein AB0M39_35090 [Streptomyces sp. NPDC051907]|uniref:hypothetical protein n=1 Tax=Streptomyces sp. NPDC051907 TaxID=3155284 RepID=UPI00342C0968
MSADPLRPDRYLCPQCKRWRGEHFKTGVLARHSAAEGTRYDLCMGSLRPIKGLPTQRGGRDLPTRHTAPYSQPPLFADP